MSFSIIPLPLSALFFYLTILGISVTIKSKSRVSMSVSYSFCFEQELHTSGMMSKISFLYVSAIALTIISICFYWASLGTNTAAESAGSSLLEKGGDESTVVLLSGYSVFSKIECVVTLSSIKFVLEVDCLVGIRALISANVACLNALKLGAVFCCKSLNQWVIGLTGILGVSSKSSWSSVPQLTYWFIQSKNTQVLRLN